MKEFLIMRNKVKDFLEEGKCEVHSIEEAKLMVEILSEESEGFNMKYNCCPLGEYWYFSKNID